MSHPFFDALSYPWHLPEARELHRALYSAIPDPHEIDLYYQSCSAYLSPLNLAQAPHAIWKEALENLTRSGQLVTLCLNLSKDPGLRAIWRVFQAVIDSGPPAPAMPPPDAARPAHFIHDTDEVSAPEALLFQDDLTIPIGRVPALIETLHRLVKLAPAVCRMVADFKGPTQYGSGFRIGPALLLTNWHVLHDETTGKAASAVTAEFGYEDDGAGHSLPAQPVTCNVSSIIADRDDDWAVIYPNQPLNAAWPVIKLSEAVQPDTGDAAYIIQHPKGHQKKLGFIRNRISSVTDRVVQYLTDTEEGSSGAPVHDAEGRLIALHHAGGRPQQLAGRPPMKKNEGIRIPRIVQGLNGKVQIP